MTTLAALKAEMERRSGDWTLYGAIADALDEAGHSDRAHAYRWCMARRRRPLRRVNYLAGTLAGRKVPARFRWGWYSHDPIGEGLATATSPRTSDWETHALPWAVMPAGRSLYDTHYGAMGFLTVRLKELAEVYAVDPPGDK